MKVTTEFKSEDHYLVTHSVDRAQTGIRLDAFLKERYRKRSRETLKRAIDSGAISIIRNQGPHLSVGRLKPSSQLIAGDEVQVLTERKPEPEVCFDYRIIHEDETLFVIDKPPNLPVHPAGRYFFNTLLVHLRTQGHTNPLKADREYFLVHRIDKETSGILVLAKDKELCTHLTRQFAERKTEKRYLAIVHGVPPEEFEVDLPLRRSTNSVVELKMEVVRPEQASPRPGLRRFMEDSLPDPAAGQPAFTAFKRISVHTNAHGTFSLVDCFPKTGRQHQIRVHLEAAGHPIVGDKLYGRPESEALRFYERRRLTPEAEAEAALILPRHALHAAGIRFFHPFKNQMMEFTSPPPPDLAKFLALP